MQPWVSERREGGAAGLSERLLDAAGSPTMSWIVRELSYRPRTPSWALEIRAGLLGERMGRAGGASAPDGRLMSAEYAGAEPAGALSRPSSMTWGWLPDSQLLPSPSPPFTELLGYWLRATALVYAL